MAVTVMLTRDLRLMLIWTLRQPLQAGTWTLSNYLSYVGTLLGSSTYPERSTWIHSTKWSGFLSRCQQGSYEEQKHKKGWWARSLGHRCKERFKNHKLMHLPEFWRADRRPPTGEATALRSPAWWMWQIPHPSWAGKPPAPGTLLETLQSQGGSS